MRRMVRPSASPRGNDLIRDGVVKAPLVLTRAQVSTSSTAQNGTATQVEFGADVPRPHVQTSTLSGTNYIRNPRGEGAINGTVGGVGVMPTNYSVNAGGLTFEVVGSAIEGGVEYVRYRVSGVSASTSMIIAFDATSAIAALPSQVWTGSWHFRLVAAPAAPVSHTTRIATRDVGGTAIANGATAFTPTSSLTRYSRSQTLSSSVDTAYVTFSYAATVVSGQSYDWTFDIGWPQMELAASATDVMLPPRGILAVSNRYDNTPTRLMVGGQRTNAVRNPRCEGAIAGTPGTLPTNWTRDGAATSTNGLTANVIGSGRDSGIDYVTLQIVGTTTDTVGRAINFEAGNIIAASSGQTWSTSCYVMLEPGYAHVMPAETALHLRMYATGGTDTTGLLFVPTTSWVRRTNVRTMPASTTHVVPRIRYAATAAGIAMDFRIRVGWPQTELAGFASSTILPPVGSPAASTRGADSITGTFASLFPTGSGTIIGSFRYDNLPGGTATYDFVQVDDGTSTNEHAIRILSATNVARLVRIAAGVETTSDCGTPTIGTAFSFGLTWNGSGRVAASINGGTVSELTGGATGLTTLRIGSGTPTFGDFGRTITLPYSLDNATLQARVAGHRA